VILSIGLTGGIGSGKSTVAAELVALGAWLIDTDAIARELTAPGGAAIPALAGAFGAAMIDADGALDRDRMRRQVFDDPEAKARLEALLHPLIGARAEARAAQAGDRVRVFDVPLLTERSHWRTRVDRVLVVDCPEALQVSRVMARSGWTADAVQRVIAQQATRTQRRSIADAVLYNGEATSLPVLRADVQALWCHWCGPRAGSVEPRVEQ
jgi:dephospho-CoA kinase